MNSSIVTSCLRAIFSALRYTESSNSIVVRMIRLASMLDRLPPTPSPLGYFSPPRPFMLDPLFLRSMPSSDSVAELLIPENDSNVKVRKARSNRHSPRHHEAVRVVVTSSVPSIPESEGLSSRFAAAVDCAYLLPFALCCRFCVCATSAITRSQVGCSCCGSRTLSRNISRPSPGKGMCAKL